MALEKKSDAPASAPTTWLKFNSKTGKFVSEDDAYDKISDFRLILAKPMKDSYEGQERDVLHLVLDDGDNRYDVAFNAHTTVACKLLATLAAADLSVPMSWATDFFAAGTQPKFMKEVLKQNLVVLHVSQNGKRVSPSVPVPAVTHVMVGKTKVADTSERDEWADGEIKKLKEKLASSQPGQQPVEEEKWADSVAETVDF